MVQPHFPVLPDATLTAINTVGEWLAQDDLRGTSQTPDVDGVILAGNAVIPTIEAACRIAAEKQVPLLISGGIGHSTTFLYDAIRHHPRYHPLPVSGRAEAAFLPTLRGSSGRSPSRACGLKIAPLTAEKTPDLAGTC